MRAGIPLTDGRHEPGLLSIARILHGREGEVKTVAQVKALYYPHIYAGALRIAQILFF